MLTFLKKLHTHWPIILTVFALVLFLALAGGFVYWQVGGSLGTFSDSSQLLSNFSFPKTYDQPLIIKLSDLAISIAPLNALPAQAQTEKNVVRYINAYANTDIVQTKSFNKIKEDIILKQPGHPDIFEYQIDLAQFDVSRDDPGNLYFFQKGHQNDNDYKRFIIPAPFMVDADGKKSSTEEVASTLTESGRLALKPSAEWLAKAKYPVILDPTIEINVINVHSHPQQGDNWTVDFTTRGTADLKIIPNDQATIDDDEFISLSCGTEKRQPQILEGDVIYYPNWSCDKTATVIHYTKKAGNHTLRFEFLPADSGAGGGQVSYAYNNYISATGGTITYTDSNGENPRSSPAYAGGYTVHTFTSTAFPDSETTPKTITTHGDTKISTTQSKFGGASALFDGTGDYLSLADSADWDFGTGEFTIETWVYFNSIPSYQCFFSHGGQGVVTTDYQGWVLYYYSGTNVLMFRHNNGADVISTSSSWTPVINTWYHIAVTRDSSQNVRTFINGTQIGSTTAFNRDISQGAYDLRVGRTNAGDNGGDINGYLEELRISKGIARWTSNFTPPTSAYSADANTNLLLHANGTGTFTVTGSGNVDYLVVAGGGGSGSSNNGGWPSGGGGAGGMLTGTLVVTAQTYSITVGDGGNAGVGSGTTNCPNNTPGGDATQGGSSIFSSITATGGGIGGKGDYNSTINNGGAGGSGGGGGSYIGGTTGGNGTNGQGYNGAGGVVGGGYPGGGGGGAGGAGSGINGGSGASSSILGSTVTYTVGGRSTTGTGNVGAGGANTGNGAGGSNSCGASGYSGGSGIVIVRYASTGISTPIIFRSAYVPAVNEFSATGGTITYTDSNGANPRSSPAYDGGYTVHTFTDTDVVFKDSETTPKTVTTYGNAIQSATQSKFGGKSAYFDGTGDYLSLADSDDFSMGSSDFTVDLWVWPSSTQTTNYPGLVYQGETAGNQSIMSVEIDKSGGTPKVRWLIRNAAGTLLDITTSSALTNDAWNHIAAVRNGSNFNVYINGTSGASASTATALENYAYPLLVGARIISPTTYAFTGYLDELRISKGIARWTANFTPPTSAYSADANTNLLLHAENSLAVTGSGNVEYLVVAGGGGGGGSAADQTAGAGGGAGGMKTSTVVLPSGSITITVGAGGTAGAVSTVGGNGVVSSIGAYVTTTGGGGGGPGGAGAVQKGAAGGSSGGVGGGEVGWTSNSPVEGEGHIGGSSGDVNHTASSGGGGKGGDGGASVSTNVGGSAGPGASSSISGSPVTYATGGAGRAASTYDPGTNGTANTGNGATGGRGVNSPGGIGGSGIVIVRYKPVAAVAATPGLPLIFRSAYAPATDTYTKLLLHTDGTNGSTTFTDSESVPKTVTANGNAQISTAQSKFGGASGLFDGTGDYLSLADNADWNLGSGDFTIDFWVYPSSETQTVFWYGKNTWGAASNIGYGVYRTPDNFVFQAFDSSSPFMQLVFAASSMPVGSWSHIAIVRNGTTGKVYVNGTELASDTSAGGSHNSDSAMLFYIGHTDGYRGDFNGYIDEFRVSKGIARWTANFTPPTSAYSSTGVTGLPIIFK